MNTLTVTAHGSPNSFARNVQVDPTIAVDLRGECRKVVDASRAESDLSAVVDAVAKLSTHIAVLDRIHNMEAV